MISQSILDGVSSKAANSGEVNLEHQGRQRSKKLDHSGKITSESKFCDQSQKVEPSALNI